MIKLRAKVLSWAGMLICSAAFVQAAPFAQTIRFEQPDGAKVDLWGKGDEFSAVFETPDGFTVTFDPAKKAYVYAQVSADGTALIDAGMEVGKGDPRTLGLTPHLRISLAAMVQQAQTRFQKWDADMNVTRRWEQRKSMRRMSELQMADGPSMAPPSFKTTGNKNGLCLLIDFEDDPATVPQGSIVNFCNGDAYAGYGNNGSVKKYFQDVSNNTLTYSNVVTAYIRIPNAAPYHPKSWYNDTTKDCGGQASLLIHDAVAIMKALPNYATEIQPTFSSLTTDGAGNIEACNIFYAGGNGGVWAMGLWPHSSGISPLELAPGKNIARYQATNIGNSLEIGTFCHENGHMLCGFPDIYDYDYDSKGGAGNFCLMDYGGGGVNPVQVCGYLKYVAGWTTTVDLTSRSSLTITLTASPGDGFNHFYRYAKPGVATEYYLFENRQRAGRDANINASGIAIWHVDELGDKDNQSLVYNTSHLNYECTLMQADNLWDFQNNVNAGDANDLYFKGNSAVAYNSTFSDSSTPAARWWDGTASLIEAESFSVSGNVMTFSLRRRPPVMLTVGALPDGWVATPYSYLLSAVGGATPYTWAMVSGALPAGLSFGSDGTISGTPTEATTALFSVAVLGDNNLAATNQFSLTIRQPLNIPLTETFEHSGANPEGWVLEFVTNAVPWVYRNGGVLGHPVSAHGGSYNACLSVTAADPAITRLVTPPISFGPSPRAAQMTFWLYNENYAGDQDELRVLYKTSAAAPWTLIQTFSTSVSQWKQETVTLPEPGPVYFIAFEGTARFGYGIYVDDVNVFDPTPPLGLTNGEVLPEAVINVPYTNILNAVGGRAPYTFTLASGALPAGMSLSTIGVISGTTPTVGTATFSVRLTDADSSAVTAPFTLTVTLPKVVLFTETFENGGQIPVGWTQEYVTNTVSWRFQSGGGDGNNQHQPVSAHGGGFNAVLWTSSRPDHKTRLVTPAINLGAAPASIRLSFWHCMTVDAGDQDQLRVFYKTSATGEWTLIPNATYTANVPDWTQRILVVPNPTSTYYLAFEGNAKFGNGVCLDDIRIADEASAPIITTTTPLPNGLVNVPYLQTLAATGGVEPYTWTVVSNALPAGLTLSGDGIISGTPAGTALANFRVRVSGSDGYASTNLFSLRIAQVQIVPTAESFENSGSIPTGWTQERKQGSANWTFRYGSPRGIPAAPHSGQYNACLYTEDSSFNIVKLVSPMLNLGVATPNTTVSFWMCMASDGIQQDQMRVYYKTAAAAPWNLLATYTQEVKAWTNIVLTLPNTTPNYFIAFEGWAISGRGVCIDDVTVSGSLSPYESWKTFHFSPAELTAGLITGDNDDPDGDGIVNLLEYAMGLDPRLSSTAGVPFGGVTAGYLTLTYRENKAATDVRFGVEACTSLVSSVWSTNGVSEISRADSNLWWSVTTRHDVPVSAAPSRFMRLKVDIP